MPFFFFSLLNRKNTTKANINIIIDGTIILAYPSNCIIKKSYSPCKSTAKDIPIAVKMKPLPFFVKDIATKYPIIAEHSVCRKVAPTKRIKLIINVLFIKSLNEKALSIGANKYKMFSRPAKPKAEITI